jgi:phenylalanyl-tRNA synthetase alpha chain
MDIKKVLNEATKEIEQSSNQLDLQNVKVAYLGKKGKITELLKSLKDLSLDEKKSTGAELNQLRGEVDNLIKIKFNQIKVEEINSKLRNESLDFSFRGIKIKGY